MKTTLHHYSFNLYNSDDVTAYNVLCEKLNDGRHAYRVLPGSAGDKLMNALRDQKSIEVELETKHLYANQWNTAPIEGITEQGFRVFDWYEAIYHNDKMKEGHYLEITDAMKEIRQNTLVCGYCGHMESKEDGATFCHECLGSAYLEEKQLHLLRMLPVSLYFSKRKALTKKESEYLTPLWRNAQLCIYNERAAAKRDKLRQSYEKAVRHAKMEYDGYMWLMDRDINTDNVIFYAHSERFSFGWRKPVDNALVSKLLDVISEFGYPYEIKCADGRKLEGNIE